jgi:hypothetical protein
MAETQQDTQEPEDSVHADDYLMSLALETAHVKLCRRCGDECKPEDQVKRSSHIVYCKRCNAAYTMLVRNLAWPPADFSSLSEEDQQSFWKACKEEVSAEGEGGGRLKYSTLKALLIKQVVARKIHSSKAEEVSDPKPLAVWKNLGWDVQRIEKHGKKIWNEAAGWLYEVPVVVKTRAVIMEQIESRLTQSEQQIRQKKRSGEENVLDPAESDEDADRSGPKPAKKSKKGIPAKQNPSKADRQAARKQEQEDRKHNKLAQHLATRVVGLFTNIVNECKTAKESASKHQASLPPQTYDEVIEVCEKLMTYNADANAILKSVATVATKGGRLAELSFDFKAAALLNGEAKVTLRKYAAVVKALKL